MGELTQAVLAIELVLVLALLVGLTGGVKRYLDVVLDGERVPLEVGSHVVVRDAEHRYVTQVTAVDEDGVVHVDVVSVPVPLNREEVSHA